MKSQRSDQTLLRITMQKNELLEEIVNQCTHLCEACAHGSLQRATVFSKVLGYQESK